MSNQTKKKYDKVSILKDIIEREKIIYQFQNTGFLDRNDAIMKINKLQIEDVELKLATTLEQIQSGSVDLYQVDNSLIVTNMQFQIDFLKAKLTSIEMGEKENG